ncbi:MAG: DNA polymerase III subunit delta [bacterium]|nr:DNA polymerase III subunit delta [bacterium]
MIYLIHGVDSFRAHEKLKELIAEFGAKDKGRMNLEVFDVENMNANNIKAASQSLGFFSPARMIIIKNLFSEGDIKTKEEIPDYVIEMDKKNGSTSSPQGFKVDFVFFERLEIGKKGAAGGKEWSALAKKGNVFNFAPMAPAEINKWIGAKIAKEKIKITPQAVNKLALFVGGDLWRLNAEIEKLVLLKMDFSKEKKYEDYAEINEQDVEDLVKSDLPSNIFSTIDALARRDKKTALKLLAGHLEKGEAPIYLFTMFVYQFRNLLKVKDAMTRKKTANSGVIAEETKLHPFVVSKTIAQANGFSYEYLRKLYKRFFKFDFLIKKGRLNAEAALELLIIEIGNLS